VVLGYLRGRGFPDPEDVCGEVFLEVVRDLDRFAGDERRFRSWVLTIAHHRGLDAARRRARRPSDATDTGALDAALPAARDAADEALERTAMADTARLLACLGDDQREDPRVHLLPGASLVLRIVAGLTAAEIGEVTGRNREAVKALQKRAIRRLREELGVDVGDTARVRSADVRSVTGTGPPPGDADGR
jgi:RNA polymerase sigma factor (sigma-70 family)